MSGPLSSGHIIPKDNADTDPNSVPANSAVPINSAAQSNIIDLDPYLHLELDFQSGVSSHLFRSWGTLILWSNRSLPYLVLNATLHNKGRQVGKANCMLMQIEAGKKYSFDISKNMRIPNGDYACILEALGPFGQITSEKRDCLTLEEPADSIFFDEIDAADKSSSNDALGQYRTEVLQEKGTSQDNYANNEQTPERISRISSSDMAKESNRDVEKSYGSEPGYNPKADGQDSLDSQESNPQDLSSGRSSEGSVLRANRTNSDNQPIPLKGNTQIADHDDNEIFVGSTGSNKYHRPDCRFVAKIKNKINYKSAEEAKQNGKVPCKICNPP